MKLLTRDGEHAFELTNDTMNQLIEQVVPHAMMREVTDEMVDDISVAAVEAGDYGIGYWCSGITGGSYRRLMEGEEGAPDRHLAIADGGPLFLQDSDDDTIHELTRSKLKFGIAQAARKAGMTVEAWHDQHDAAMADTAFQYGLFGEVIYG